MFTAHKSKTNFRAIRGSKLGRYILASAISGALALTAVAASAQTLTTLYSFSGGSSGNLPEAGVVADGSGNLYGTTLFGGNVNACVNLSPGGGCGLVFKLTRPSSSGGAWAANVLYSFSGSDGEQPTGNLTFDPSGNLFGATTGGGNGGGSCGSCGVTFEINPSGAESTLHAFTGGSDGSFPLGGLTIDSSLNLYGTTQSGGASSGGTVFELVNSAGNYSTKKVLYSFVDSGMFPNLADSGYVPAGSLTIDTSGNIFGVTTGGGDMSATCFGAAGCGVVFELVNSSGNYTEKVLYAFQGGADGFQAETGVIEDASGNLFGTTQAGGDMSACNGNGCGVVFELVNSSGNYTYKTLYTFTGGADGANPLAGLIEDASGNLYGTTVQGGDLDICYPVGCGVVFKVAQSGAETILYTFIPVSDGGYAPISNLIADATGNLYGTTVAGGTGNYGTVFELSGSGFTTASRFAGVPGTSNCKGMSISTVAQTYGGIAHAATSLGYTGVAALQGAVTSYCGTNSTAQ